MGNENVKITERGKHFLYSVYVEQSQLNGEMLSLEDQQATDIFIQNTDCVRQDIIGKRIVSTFGTKNLAKAVVKNLQYVFANFAITQPEFTEIAFLAFEVLLDMEIKSADSEETQDWYVVMSNLIDYIHRMESLERAISDSMEAMSLDD